MKKLRNDRGETIVEVLASILIATLSVTLLFGSVMVSSRLDVKTREQDSGYYEGINKAEGQTEAIPVPAGGSVPYVSITGDSASATPPIEIYGGSDVFSYKKK